MTFNIRAMGMDMTDAIKDYAETKFAGLEKFYDNIIHIEVDLGLDTHHHLKGDIYKCITMVQVPNHVFRVEKDEKNLYKAIDKVKDHLREEMIAWKEKVRGR
ncbi:MAG: ribosome-associated translation inhibitor RaiA [Patescibacteria group bacterium]